MGFDSGIDQAGNGTLSISGSAMSSDLMEILEQDALDPGSEPGYQACKTIYSNHPLGSRMVDAPLEMAMSQDRQIEIPGAPEEELKKAFKREWKRIGAIGADNIIFRGMQLSYIYGISTLACNVVDKDGVPQPTDKILPMDKIWELDIYFNIFDPLNTAGSLVLNQDPRAVDFMHPKQVSVGSQVWSNTKTIVLMHEQPIWIQWTSSAFGFVGRSVYQRAFYPLKSFLVSMLADQMVQEKLGVLVYKSKSPGPVLNMAARAFKSMQRMAIKGARTNSILSIGETEDLASLNMEHVHTAGEYSRNNILKNIATAAGQPASLLNQETLAEGFGEGSEDAKTIARYVDRVRIEMNPAYDFMDGIVQRRAWNPVFYAEMQKKYPERYAGMSYEAAFRDWQDAFTVTWPNLLTEPDSEKAKASQAKLDSAAKIAQVIMAADVGQETKAEVCAWLADVANDEKEFYSSPLVIDADAMAAYEPMQEAGAMGDDPEGPQNKNSAPGGHPSDHN
jgi:hypothetical protein